jgi:lysophospholipase L1-like esterase
VSSWKQRAALVVGSLVFTFVLLELGIRALDFSKAHNEVPWALYDEELGYRLNTALPEINELGMRDHPLAPKGERLRLLMLGDSLAFYGDDIDDTWVGRLEHELAQPPLERDVDVLNAGVRGYTHYQQLLYLRRDGIALEPDLVGVGFVLNDLHDFLTVFEVVDGVIVGNRHGFSDDAVAAVSNPVYQALRRSRFLVWLRRELATAIDSVLMTSAEGYSFDYRPDFLTAWQPEPWQKIEAQFEEMQDLAQAHDFRLFVVAFPFADQYVPAYLERDRAYVLYPQRRLAEICQRLQIPLLDLYPVLDADRHLLDDKIHLTPEGRGVVARQVAELLRSGQLLSSSPAGEDESPSSQ